MNEKFWFGRRVAITGHTGFKGSWLAFWLNDLCAEVSGYSLPPEVQPALYTELDLSAKFGHELADIRDAKKLSTWVLEKKPEVVFHLAAQPLVLRSYQEARVTWETNVLGTINLLEAIRQMESPCVVLVITTDKVYQNFGRAHAFKEGDRLGGEDPYSSSKAAVELAVHSWRTSFFQCSPEVRVATARAGNVIGGGDWAVDRIVPDLARSLSEQRPVVVRNPDSVRPWQHVLDPLSGYLRLAEELHRNPNRDLQGSFNFGPGPDDFRTVRHLVEECLSHWTGKWAINPEPQQIIEKTQLRLNCEKAHSLLDWEPRLTFSDAIKQTMDWYRSFYEKKIDSSQLCRRQIAEFQALES